MGRPLQRYVLGIPFTNDLRYVSLIKKLRGPINMAGKLNGIGGKIEPGEGPLQAMSREMEEETGVLTSIQDWKHFARLTTPAALVELLYVRSDKVIFASTATDEKVKLYNTAMVERGQAGKPMVENLPFIVGVARAFAQGAWPRLLATPIELKEHAA